MSVMNKLKRVFQCDGGSGGGSGGSGTMRISVAGGTITVTGGTATAYPADLAGKTIEVWGAGGAGTLIDPGDGYSFNSGTGALSALADGNYLIIIF
jgi:hypothetical protein